MKILVHDYAGHPFQVQLSRQLARRDMKSFTPFSPIIRAPKARFRSPSPVRISRGLLG